MKTLIINNKTHSVHNKDDLAHVLNQYLTGDVEDLIELDELNLVVEQAEESRENALKELRCYESQQEDFTRLLLDLLDEAKSRKCKWLIKMIEDADVI